MSTKAQKSLANAFNELVLERPYHDIHIADIIKRADVSRSTFYEHFRNKEQILVESLSTVLKPIAEATVVTKDGGSFTPILDHFVEVKELALVYFHSPVSRVMVELLTQLTMNQIGPCANSYRIPIDLLCAQIAQANLGLIEAWLNSESRVSSIDVADRMVTSTQALIATGEIQ